VQLDGSGSTTNPVGGELSYNWRTNCIDGSFNDENLSNPILSLITATSDNMPLSCAVFLRVTNSQQISTECSSPVTAKTCNRDCLGVINGSAQVDRCGVCNGNGSTCDDCNSQDIKDEQIEMDINSNSMRDNVLKVNKQLKVAAKNAKLSAKDNKSEDNYIADSTIKAQKAYKDVWSTVYTAIPSVVVSCTASFCVNVSTTSYKVEVSDGTESLLTLAQKGYARILKLERKAKAKRSPNLKKVQKASIKAKSLVDSSKKLLNATNVALTRIPANQSSCS
jgi:hypothetical protein